MSTSFATISNRINSNSTFAEKLGNSVYSVLSVVFAVKLRESLDAAASGDNIELAKARGL
jgi:hypothetical protein